jgi:hypothetical protein
LKFFVRDFSIALSNCGPPAITRHHMTRDRIGVLAALTSSAIGGVARRSAVTITVNPLFASIVGALGIHGDLGINLVAGLIAVAVGIWLTITVSGGSGGGVSHM